MGESLGEKLNSLPTETRHFGHVSFGFGRRFVHSYFAHDSLLLVADGMLCLEFVRDINSLIKARS